MLNQHINTQRALPGFRKRSRQLAKEKSHLGIWYGQTPLPQLNHIQPHSTTLNHTQPHSTSLNHTQPLWYRQTPQPQLNHTQPHSTTLNHTQPWPGSQHFRLHTFKSCYDAPSLTAHTFVGLARTVHIHRMWLYIWWFPCKKPCIHIPYIYRVFIYLIYIVYSYTVYISCIHIP